MKAHGARANYPALTGLRAVLATLVVLLHLRPILDLGPLQPLVASGGRAVDVFFVLSGFILFHTYFETFAVSVQRQSYLAFLQNRLARIYPVHIVTLAGGIALFVASITLMHKVPREIETIHASSLIANLFLVHAWFSGLGSPNSPSWSISAEWFAYLFCPFLIVFFRRGHAAFLAVWAGVALLLPDILQNSLFHSDPMVPKETVAGLAPLIRIARAFSIGAIVYVFERRFALADRLPRWSALAFAGVMIANCYLFIGGSTPVHLAMSACLILALTRTDMPGAGFFASRPMVYLGEVSYSLYMCHWLVMLVMIHVLHWQGGSSLLLWASVLVLSQTTAILLYHAVELPGRRLIRKISFGQAPRPASERVVVVAAAPADVTPEKLRA